MKRQPPNARKQSGIALIMFLVVLILGGGYAFYRSANIGFGSSQRDAKVYAALARAKEALIARAVTDANRPGSLPCPDTIGDGKAAMFTLTQCPSYVGWLPWVTLDLPELTDDTGTRLWYALSPSLRDDDSAQPINSDIPAALRIDGGGEIAAIIIAPRGALSGQTRPSNNAADYLEGDNANGDANYVSGPATNSFNDVVAIITRQELMAAVEKRVANEVRACLEEHASSTLENPAQTYPWPAPLANNTFKGTAQSLFGMIPATQPGGNPDIDLKQSINSLNSAQNSLSTAWANNDLATAQQALTTINEIAANARAQFDRLFIVAEALYQSATAADTIFSQLGSTPDSSAIAAARPSLAAFQGALSDSGIDPFLAELTDQNQTLAQKINDAATAPSNTTFGALQTQINNIFRRKIYAYSTTPNPDISQTISAANVIAIDAISKAAVAKNLADYTTGPNITLANQAISRANDLLNANTTIYNTTLATRVNVDASEIRYLVQRLGTLLTAYSAAPDTDTLNTLASALDGTIQSVTAISTGTTTVLAAKVAAVGALSATLPANPNTVISLTGVAITRTDALATAIENNGDNVLLETLKIADSKLALAITGALDAATLKDTIDRIDYWATQTATYANDIARKARKRVNIPTTNDSSTSAYTRAGQLLASLDGSTGSIALLNDYIQTPSDTAKATAAQAAVNATQTALSNTISSASTLETILESGTAQAATETRWYGNACAFLRPASGTPSWWAANKWASTTFYQISDRVRPAVGKLTVNGSGTYRVVVISAGKALTGQDSARNTRKTTHFLEGINADTNAPTTPGAPSIPGARDGNAQNPPTAFSSEPVSAIFNDRLAY